MMDLCGEDESVVNESPCMAKTKIMGLTMEVVEGDAMDVDDMVQVPPPVPAEPIGTEPLVVEGESTSIQCVF